MSMVQATSGSAEIHNFRFLAFLINFWPKIQRWNHHIRIISKRFAVVKSICVSTNLAVSISEPFCLVITQILTNLLPDPWLLEKLAWTILHFFIIVGSGIWIKKEIFRYGNMNKKILHHYYKIFVENLKLLCNILVQHITSDNQFVCN